MEEASADTAQKFHAMVDATPADWAAISKADALFARKLPDWLKLTLKFQDDDCHGFAVNRLEHSLQTATRAYRDGRGDEYTACALIHDIGATLAPQHHAEFGALILRPYISDQNFWMMQHHGIFQDYYFSHFFGADRNQRERFRGHPHFEYTAQFCHLYDQNSFDPNYRSMSLEEFDPIIRRVTARRRR